MSFKIMDFDDDYIDKRKANRDDLFERYNSDNYKKKVNIN